MYIPAWATHLFTFTHGGKVRVVAVADGKYQYVDDGDGRIEPAHNHAWGVKDWKEALRDGHFNCTIELADFSLENE